MSIKHSLFFALVFFVTWSSTAQVKISSPISILGFGEIIDRDQLHVQTLGGLAASFHAVDRLNVSNPASLAYLNTTVFAGGLQAKRSVISDGNAESKGWSGNMTYFSLGMPLQNQINALFNRKNPKVKWGMNLQLSPFSATGFNYNEEEELQSGATIQRSYEGDGSTYILGLSNGWKYKNFAAGLTLGYLFGSNQFDRTATFPIDEPGGAYSYSAKETDKNRYRAFVWNYGMMYDIVFGRIERADGSKGAPNKYLTLGLTYHSNWAYKSESDQFVIRENRRIATQTTIDTLTAVHDVAGAGQLPAALNFGLSYVYKQTWRAGLNYQRAMWSNYENTKGQRTLTVDDAFKLSGGLAYTPNSSSITSFLERVTYSIGIAYGKDPRLLNGNQLENYGVKVGFSLPFVSQRQVSHVNLNFGLGRLGLTDGYKENYFSFGLGYALSDNQWFFQTKYD